MTIYEIPLSWDSKLLIPVDMAMAAVRMRK